MKNQNWLSIPLKRTGNPFLDLLILVAMVIAPFFFLIFLPIWIKDKIYVPSIESLSNQTGIAIPENATIMSYKVEWDNRDIKIEMAGSDSQKFFAQLHLDEKWDCESTQVCCAYQNPDDERVIRAYFCKKSAEDGVLKIETWAP